MTDKEHPRPAAATAPRRSARYGLSAALVSALLSAACSSLIPAKPAPPTLYALDAAAASPGAGAVNASAAGNTVLIVHPTRAAAGHDSARIVYRREPHSLAAYTQSEWVDSPARMLTPLIVASLQARPDAFRAVLSAPTAAATDVRLDTDLVRLQQEFDGASPSRVRFTLRATLTETATRRVLATQVFEAAEPSPSEDAKGGVAAANAAVRSVLAQLGAFCAQAARQRAPMAGGAAR